MRRHMTALIPLALIVAVLGILGCLVQGDYEVPLPNGYLLVRSNSYDIAIFGPKELHQTRVVAPLIVALAVNRDLVFGEVTDSHNPWLGENTELANRERGEQERARGYFLLDTKAHSVQLGLTRKAWLLELQKHGLSTEPRLEKPDRNFGHHTL